MKTVRQKWEVAAPLVIAAAVAMAMSRAFGWDRPGARLFPLAIAVPVIAMCLLQSVMAYRRALKGATATDRARRTAAKEERSATDLVSDYGDLTSGEIQRSSVVAFSWFFSLVFLIWVAGFYVALIVFILLYLAIRASVSWPMAAAAAALASGAFFILDKYLSINLPESELLRLL